MKQIATVTFKVTKEGGLSVRAIVDGELRKVQVEEGDTFETNEKIARAYRKYKSSYEEVTSQETPKAKKGGDEPKSESVKPKSPKAKKAKTK